MSDVDMHGIRIAIEPYAELGRSGMLPALHAAQRINGWISEPIAREIAGTLRVPLADLHGVIEFYTLFYNKPVGRRVIRICTDIACALRDSDAVLDHLCTSHKTIPGATTSDGEFTIESSPCLGLCEQAPAGLVGEQAETSIQLDRNAYELGGPRSIVGGTTRLLTANCGHGTTSLAGHGEYAGLRRALSLGPSQVTAEIKASGLVGRGGAAFPAGVKWEGASAAPDVPKYVVCNADESEPGTFKDRVLMMDDPHTLLEGMLIAGYAIGAKTGYIYLRGEYPYILPVLENAIAEARAAGLLGAGILGSTFEFDVQVRLGAGAYICGEETALFESIEGKRGFPRIKPPFPTTFGLFGKPTVINNVETLFNVPLIISRGVDAYRSMGTEKSPGSKLFCVSGDAGQPGVYEVPFGVTLRELLEMAGGVAGGRSVQAVLFGGAAGAFAIPSQLDVRLTFEDLRAAGLPLGSGVVMVFDDTRDMRDVLRRLGSFFAHESCGKCYPCQMGTQRQKEILERVADGRVQAGDVQRLQDVGWTMTDSSLCGLGQTAASAVLSAIEIWPNLFVKGRARRKPTAKKAPRAKAVKRGRPKSRAAASKSRSTSKSARSKPRAAASKSRSTSKSARPKSRAVTSKTRSPSKSAQGTRGGGKR